MTDLNITVEENEERVISAPSPKMSIIEPDNKNKNKVLGVFYGIGMNVNNVIGSGIVTTPGIIWNSVKSPGIVLLLWLIGGIVSMSGSLTYVELGAIHNTSGGETLYLQSAYPNPKLLMSYLFSFMFVFAIRPGILCAVLQSAAQYFWFTIKGTQFDLFIDQNKNGWKLPFSPYWFIKILAITILFVITLYHMINTKCAILINQFLVIVKMITYLIIASFGIYRLCQNSEVSRNNWKNALDGSADITNYSSSILLIMFAYNGWNNLNYSLDEFRNPEKKLILSNSISVGIVTVIYLLVNVAFISVVPSEKILNAKINETIAAEFFRQLFGGNELIVRIFTFLVVLSVMGTAAVDVWSGSRVIVKASASDFFPKELSILHHRFNTPVNALLAQFIWCSIIILFVGSSFTISTFTLFSTFSMYSHWIFYFVTGIGYLLIIRRKGKNRVKLEENDEELDKNGTTTTTTNNNTNNNNIINSIKRLKLKEKIFKISAGIFIISGLFILIFSFIANDTCPNCSEKDLHSKKIQNLSPIFISYGFLFLGLIFWLFFYYIDGTFYCKVLFYKKKKKEEG